jgi:glycosyltransferase involved in cell wall biosynthesis
VIGNGPEHNRLVDMAGPRVTFLTKVSDQDMPHYFQSAEAFIFPGIDDFGIVAVEALAAGTPVIAYKDGGALDYVKEGKTGLFFDEQTVESLCQTISKFNSNAFQEKNMVVKARSFAPEVFTKNMYRLINRYMI